MSVPQPAPRTPAPGSRPTRVGHPATTASPPTGPARRPGPHGPLGRVVLLQQTALAGFRHHAGPRVLPALRRDTALTLRREPENAHDANAVALYWRGEKLGYLPRRENLVAARLLDRHRNLSARIAGCARDVDGRPRIEIAVLLH